MRITHLQAVTGRGSCVLLQAPSSEGHTHCSHFSPDAECVSSHHTPGVVPQ